MILPLLLALSTTAADIAYLDADADRAFSTYLNLAENTQDPETALLITAQAWELRHETPHNPSLTNTLLRLVRDLPPGLGRIIAADLLGRHRTEQGHPTALHHILPQTTALTDWTLSGSYRRLGGPADLDVPFPPERLNSIPHFTNELVSHPPLSLTPSSDRADLRPWDRTSPPSGTVYLLRTIHGQGPTTLLLETRQAFKVFLDGHTVAEYRSPDGEGPLFHLVRLPLLPGRTHTLLLKLTPVTPAPSLKTFLLPPTYAEHTNLTPKSDDPYSHALAAKLQGRTKDFHRAFLGLERQGDLTPARACFYASCILADSPPADSPQTLLAVRLLKSIPSSARSLALLARHHHRQGLTETALDEANQAVRSSSADGLLPRLVRAELHADLGWTTAFRSDLDRVLTLHPTSPDGLGLLARWNERHAPEHASTTWSNLAAASPAHPAIPSAVRWLSANRKTDLGRTILAAYERTAGASPLTALLAAHLDIVSCRTQTAAANLRKTLGPYPHNPHLLETLADLDPRHRKELLRQAVRLAPTDLNLRDKLAFTEHGRPYTMEELLDDRLRQAAIHRFLSTPPLPGTSAEILLNEEILVVGRDGSWSSVRRHIVRINDRNAVQVWGNPTIDNAPRLRILAAHTILRSGEEVPAPRPRAQEGSLVVTFPGLSEDCLIELAWCLVGQPNDVPHTFLHTSAPRLVASLDHPVHTVHHTVIAPSDLDYTLTASPTLTVRTDRSPHDRVVRWTITASNLPAIGREPHLPSLESLSPSWTLIRPFKDWPDLAAWYRSLTAPSLADNPDLETLLPPPQPTGPARTATVRNLYGHIGRTVRPVTGGPYTAADDLATVLYQGRGTEEERTLLMKHLLDHLGVTNTLLLVRNTERPPISPSTPPHPRLFDSLLLAVVLDGHTNLLDLSDRWLPFGSIGWEKEGATALDTATGRLLKVTPTAARQPDLLVLSNRITVLTDRALLKGRRTYLGQYGLYAELFADRRNRDLHIHQTEQRDLPDLRIDRIDFHPENTPPGYTVQGTAPAFASATDNGLLLPYAGRKANLGELFAASPSRRSSLRVAAPVRMRQRVEYDLSALGKTLHPILPPPTDLTTPWGRFRLHWRLEGTLLVAENETDLPPTTVRPEDYPAFAAFCRAADAAERTPVLIRLRH